MTAKQCRGEIARHDSRIPARVYSRIQDRAANGKRYLLCSSNKETRKQLKSDGFGCILLVNLTLVWW